MTFDNLLTAVKSKYELIIKDIEDINKLINSQYMTPEQENQLMVVLIECTDKLAKSMQLVPTVKKNGIR